MHDRLNLRGGKRKICILKIKSLAVEQSDVLEINFGFSDALLFIRVGIEYQSEIMYAYKYISLSGQSRGTARGAS